MYDDPSEMRAEYDLIMQWLARSEISAAERRILTIERDNLAPQLNIDRQRVVGERHAARVLSALTPPDPEAVGALVDLARTIQGIAGEPGNPNLFYIYDHGERVAISREQADSLRNGLRNQLQRALRRIESNSTYYWERYHAQVALNEEHPVIAGISGWLADVEDPGLELANRSFAITAQLGVLSGHITAGDMVAAAAILPDVENNYEHIRTLARAYYEGYIEGAEIAVHRLELTRDISFAVAGSIAAVVAAPVVAGFVGVGGLGLTGAGATAATIGGTGVVVGTGMAGVRGTSAAGGVLLAGGSLSEAGSAFTSEAWRGFREGFIAGAGGSAARSLGIAIRGMAAAGSSVTAQVATRVGGEMLVNGTSTLVDSLWQSCRSEQGCNVEQAVQAALRSAVLSVPGALLGGSENPIVRGLVAPFTAGATAYIGARASGVSPEDALAHAGAAVASNILMSRAAHGSEVDAALESRGRSLGASTRQTVASTARRAAPYAAAIMIGVADAVPAVRSGSGRSPVVVEGSVSSAPVVSSPTRSIAPAPSTVEASTPGSPRVAVGPPVSEPISPIPEPTSSAPPRPPRLGTAHADSDGVSFSEPSMPTTQSARRPRVMVDEQRPIGPPDDAPARGSEPEPHAFDAELHPIEGDGRGAHAEATGDDVFEVDSGRAPHDDPRSRDDTEHVPPADAELDIRDEPGLRRDPSESTTPSERLRASLEAAEVHVPDGHDAHHIVASRGGGEAGDRARHVLENAGIGSDSAPNGVPLPRTSTDPGTVPEGLSRHQVLHTDRYYGALADVLEGVPRYDLPARAVSQLVRIDPSNVGARLAIVRELIIEGRFPH
jgi:hypothetical protein